MQIIECQFQKHGDERGHLVAIEEQKDVPFEIKRVYYMFGSAEDVIRGRHAHKKLEQVLVCVHGTCKVCLDDGVEKKEVSLEDPNKGLFVPPYLWHEMYDFSEDSVLLCFASDYYDESDYIRDYDAFLKFYGNKGDDCI